MASFHITVFTHESLDKKHTLHFMLQATQAAQEAEDNAKKAKNSVNSLLNMINELLEKLGIYTYFLSADDLLENSAINKSGYCFWLYLQGVLILN